ncbi:MAG: lipoyl(octanoyl) transferase LipB [Pseudomonadota bacterium]
MRGSWCDGMIVEEVDYLKALEHQQEAVRDLQEGIGGEVLMVLSHPPTITVGRKGNTSNIVVAPEKLAELGMRVIKTDRGGDVTFHGPGQIVCYPVFNLDARRLFPPGHIANLEEAMARALDHFGVEPVRVKGIRGIFTRAKKGGSSEPRKIGAVGVAVAKGIAYHGLALNVLMDLEDFEAIVPCGLSEYEVTSMHLHCADPPVVGEVAEVLVDALKGIYGGRFEVRTTF